MPRTTKDFKAKHDPKTIIDNLEAQLKEAKAEGDMRAAMKDWIGVLGTDLALIAPPNWTQAPLTDKGAPGVPTLLLSDFHWGERVFPAQINYVNKFDLTIARRRLKYTIDTAIHLLRILDPKMRYPGIVMPLGGDLISGNLHEELRATNELNTMPVVLDLYEHLSSAIKIMADTFGAVFLPCVSGNHGRDTMKTWAKDRNHTSFDWLLCQFLAKHFAGDKRITFFIPDGTDAHFNIYEKRYNLTHGDNLGKGGDGLIGHLGPVMRGDNKRRARDAQINRSFDQLLHGHFHSYSHGPKVIGNGSLKGYDEYAYVNAFSFEPPQQAMWVDHVRYGTTWRMPVLCEQPPAKTKSSSWVKSTGKP